MKFWVRVITTFNKWWFNSIVILTAFFIMSTIALILHIIGCSLTENCNGDFLEIQASVSFPIYCVYIVLSLFTTTIIYIFDFFKNIKSIFKFDKKTNNFGIENN
jgi:hypothetical protein